MDIDKYEELTGVNVKGSKTNLCEAMIAKSKLILENLLGYSIDEQVGSSTRIFSFNSRDDILLLDPFVSLSSVLIVEDSETLLTLDTDDYRIITSKGIKKSIQIDNVYPNRYYDKYSNAELKVTGVWEYSSIPTEIEMLQAEYVTYLMNEKRNIKSETLGTHSYTKNIDLEPLKIDHNISIVRKYRGGNARTPLIPTL